MNEIKSNKILVRDILKMWFNIPVYQRPYVWGSDEIRDLLDDVSYAAENNPKSEYFIGSIVLQSKNFIENDLLDGQQRLTTLFLLMAVIRDLAKDKQLKDAGKDFIYQEENKFTGIPERMRIISSREPVQSFMNKFIKTEGSTLQHEDISSLIRDIEEIRSKGKEIDITVCNMAKAIIQINTYFSDKNETFCAGFVAFLMNHVIMIYVSTENRDDAFRLFTVLNSRGIPLRNSDILKAINIGHIKDVNEQDKLAGEWTEIENEHGENFDRFLSFIRTLLVKEKARLNLLKEFEEKIYKPQKSPLLQKGEPTINYMKEVNNHYSTLFSGNNYDIANGWKFDNLLLIMKVGYKAKDWIPPLLAYLDKFKTDKILKFLEKLDNKFSADWIAQETPASRIESMNTILKKINKSKSANEVLNSTVFAFDVSSFLRNIEGGVYGRQWDRYILLKLDYLMQGHAQKVGGYSEISIEHILPQNPDPDGDWCRNFNDEQRDYMTNLLGNLVLISRRKNTSQGRCNYQEKKAKYFRNNIETFPNSLRVLNKYDNWTPVELQENHDYVMEKLKTHYQ
ncbi:protein containing DUF262 [Candidatus Magnetobacterium bavaricum]|uniref:Protein containing DUF262 n=1 Tax=Candidatus Magnetobacterium bavaricum TaxID=29290 RepID=A0A0F3GJA7_9BACT|nr:protein containing DUF262 [Candidatus Magnetobacterium bavaricum]